MRKILLSKTICHGRLSAIEDFGFTPGMRRTEVIDKHGDTVKIVAEFERTIRGYEKVGIYLGYRWADSYNFNYDLFQQYKKVKRIEVIS